MTTAGGTFASETLPNVTIQIDEGLLKKDFAHLVEVSIENTREEAIEEANKLISVEGEKQKNRTIKNLLSLKLFTLCNDSRLILFDMGLIGV